MRVPSALAGLTILSLLACSGTPGPIDGSPGDASSDRDAATADAMRDPDTGYGGAGAVCGNESGDDAGVVTCEPGLVCCYPCGIPGCNSMCMTPCDGGAGCARGCPLIP